MNFIEMFDSKIELSTASIFKKSNFTIALLICLAYILTQIIIRATRNQILNKK